VSPRLPNLEPRPVQFETRQLRFRLELRLLREALRRERRRPTG
jgi:hypothetical protein